ncbi:hypothetical protein QTG56_25810 (plasmid) [Rossellomorea sp. AcN35-11]|nr:hypothetical protein QTG56_25810 [Rossellomorea sp. AcN35-11]
MAVDFPQIEDRDITQYIPPQSEYKEFENEAQYEEMGKEWGLFGKTPKKDFWFKGKGYKRSVKVIGFIKYGVTGTFHTLIIEFQDGNKSCIHPDYLKEMQKSTFGKETEEPPAVVKKPASRGKVLTSDDKPKSKAKKESAQPDVALPADKVTFEAKVKDFSTKPNPFSDNDDEILILEDVRITEGEQIGVGQAWCGYSKTLKKVRFTSGAEYRVCC